MLRDEFNNILKNEFDNIVVSKLNEKIKKLCFESGGEFIEVTSNNSDVNELMRVISKFEDKEKKEKLFEYKELFYYFLILAFILFFIATSGFKFIILIFFIITKSEAYILDFYYIKNAINEYENANYQKASEYFKNLTSNEALYNLANSYYKSGNYELAIETYKQIKSNDRNFKSKVFYNLANTLVKIKNYDLAKEFYTNSLILEFSDEAYFNRELIKELKERDFLTKKNKNSSNNNSDDKNKEDKQDKKEAGGSKHQMDTNSDVGKAGKMEELLLKPDNNKRPFSYKEYQLINQGKTDEKAPW